MRISFFLSVFIVALFADIKIFATKAVEENNNTIELFNPIIIYKDSIIQANRGFITNKRKIVLKGNVYISYKNRSLILANSLRAFSSENITMSDIFFYDKTIGGWIKAKKSKSQNKKIKFRKLFFSTCCINDPDWFMKAARATYNRKDKDLKLYNITLVINKVPVFYMPYLYLNFNRTRRSGLLRPYVGYSDNEGILYSQPVYFVTSVNTDLEITPTIRTLRGRGVYAIFRFVDSPYSNGEIKGGVFKDYSSYYKKNNLANQEHFGYSLLYQRSKTFFDKDALYLDLKYANDVDYFYLDAYNYKFNDVYLSDKLITSKANYIYPTKHTLYGLYFKYFIDTTQINNDKTWQILPQVNIHRYLTKNRGFLNSFDANIYNYYRKSGSNFLLSDILIPVSYNFSLKHDYLKIKITEQFSGGYGFYYQTNSLRSRYYNLSTQFKIYDSLTKTNGKYIHIISPSILINLKNISDAKIYSDLINVSDIKNYISLNLFQILQSGKFSLVHTLNDTYYIDKDKFSDFENIFKIKYNKISIDENNRYSIEAKDVTYNNIKISYNNDKFSSYIAHIYQKNVSETALTGVKYHINKFKQAYVEYSYDIKNDYTKYWLLGVKLNKKCWSYNFSFKQSRIPVLEENGISYRKDNIVSLQIELKPIGGINQTFVFKGHK